MCPTRTLAMCNLNGRRNLQGNAITSIESGTFKGLGDLNSLYVLGRVLNFLVSRLLDKSA